MGTGYSITISDAGRNADRTKLTCEVNEALQRINRGMSVFDPESEVARFNRHPEYTAFSFSEDVFSVISNALILCSNMDGYYDITAGPLITLWGFGPGTRFEKPPSRQDISEAVGKAGWRNLTADYSARTLIKKKKGVEINLSSIAKGYGVDAVCGVLNSHGYKNYLVEIGGEVRTAGTKKDGSKWVIGIAMPDKNADTMQRAVYLENAAVATSGDYQNFFIYEGVQYSHLINPVTGYPVPHELVSVSIIAENCMTADGLATGIIVHGWQKGYIFAEKNNIPAYFIVRTDEGYTAFGTPAFSNYLKETHKTQMKQ